MALLSGGLDVGVETDFGPSQVGIVRGANVADADGDTLASGRIHAIVESLRVRSRWGAQESEKCSRLAPDRLNPSLYTRLSV